MRRHSTLAMSLVFGAAAAACGPSDGGGGGGGSGDTPDAGGNGDTPDARGSGRVDAGPRVDGGPDVPPPGAACTKMDIVFVVDNSGSMSEEQRNLADNFAQFAQVLDEYKVSTGEPLDYRVGLTTTARTVHTFHFDLFGDPVPDRFPAVEGEDGEFRQPSGLQRRWIESTDANRREMLQAIANVGIRGSGIEMPMDTARLALSDRMASGQPNAGFVREDALLAVVLITDEEDCSHMDGTSPANATELNPFANAESYLCTNNLGAPQAYVDFFDQLKGDRKRWATAVIAGDGMGRSSCRSTGLGDAEDAPRLKEFVTKTGENAIFRSICQGDLSTALKDALDTFQAACEGLPPIDD
jgi:hypothetical protein